MTPVEFACTGGSQRRSERSAKMRRTVRQLVLAISAACAAITLCTTPAWAQGATQVTIKPEEGIPANWMTAIRGGLGLNNTEGIVGVMWQSPGMGPAKYLRFRPGVQAGFAS